MALILDLLVQGCQMLLVLALAPGLTGLVRLTEARLLRRRGPPLIQPYRDLLRLMRKEVVLAESASWLFRAVPYLVFAGTWVAAALVPLFSDNEYVIRVGVDTLIFALLALGLNVVVGFAGGSIDWPLTRPGDPRSPRLQSPRPDAPLDGAFVFSVTKFGQPREPLFGLNAR